MLTRKAVNTLVNNFLADLKALGYQPTKAVLFGSYANGTPHQYSDVDLAVWEKSFCGVNFMDFEPFVRLVGQYHPLLQLGNVVKNSW